MLKTFSLQLGILQQSHIVRWLTSSTINVNKTKLSLNYLQFKRVYCDIKTNEELLFSSSGSPTIPTVSKIKRALKNSHIHDHGDGFSCIRTKCPACVEPSIGVSTEKHIYINKTTGDVVCPSCQHIYSFNMIEEFYQPPVKGGKTQSDRLKSLNIFMNSKPTVITYDINKIDANSLPVSSLEATDFEAICQHLNLQKIQQSTFEGLNAFCNVEKKTLYFPMQDVNGQNVGYKTLYSKSGSVLEDTVPETNSFGAVIVAAKTKRSQKEPKTAVIVLNVLDALAIRSQNPKAIVICLPHGFKTLPQECLPVFEEYDKLILWFDYNSVGWDIAKNFAKKLEEKRCLFVRPTDDQPTPYIALQNSIGIQKILQSAKPILHKAITTFRSLRQDVLSDLQNIDKVQGIKWKRYPLLNKYLKGHRRGELTILTGPTGSGKTTFMSEYSLDLALQGVNTLWGSFEIRNARLASTLLQQMVGKPLDENVEEFERWADDFEKLPIYFMTFHGQQAIKVVMEAIEHAQYVHDIHHVIIDNLQFMMGTSEESRHMDRFWKQDEIIAGFRTFATRKNCHVSLVIHPRKERSEEDLTTNSIFGSAKATQEADNVLIIQDKRLTSVKGKKYLQVAKNRYSGDLGIMVLDFDKTALSYAPKKKKLMPRLNTETNC